MERQKCVTWGNSIIGVFTFSTFSDNCETKPHNDLCYSKDVATCIHLFDGENYLQDIIVLYKDTNPKSKAIFYTTMKDESFGYQFDQKYIEKLKKGIIEFK